MNYYQHRRRHKKLISGWRITKLIPLVRQPSNDLRLPIPLPAKIKFSTTSRVRGRELFHYLFGPGFLMALGCAAISIPNNTSALVFGMISLLLGLVLFSKWYFKEQLRLFPKRTVVISRSGIQIPPTGEFLWGNIDQIFLERYLLNSPCLMIQLRNGTLVKHRLRRRYYSPSLKGDNRNYEALRHTLYEYYSLSRKKRDLSIEQPSL